MYDENWIENACPGRFEAYMRSDEIDNYNFPSVHVYMDVNKNDHLREFNYGFSFLAVSEVHESVNSILLC